MTQDDDDEVATKGFVRLELRGLEERMHADFAQHTKVIMEHMTSLMQVQGEQIQSIADKLDAHIADPDAHGRARAPRKAPRR